MAVENVKRERKYKLKELDIKSSAYYYSDDIIIETLILVIFYYMKNYVKKNTKIFKFMTFYTKL